MKHIKEKDTPLKIRSVQKILENDLKVLGDLVFPQKMLFSDEAIKENYLFQNWNRDIKYFMCELMKLFDVIKNEIEKNSMNWLFFRHIINELYTIKQVIDYKLNKNNKDELINKSLNTTFLHSLGQVYEGLKCIKKLLSNIYKREFTDKARMDYFWKVRNKFLHPLNYKNKIQFENRNYDNFYIYWDRNHTSSVIKTKAYNYFDILNHVLYDSTENISYWIKEIFGTEQNEKPLKINNIYNYDCIRGLSYIQSNVADIIIADPPYNIQKDFGNNKTNLPANEYINWCKKWIKECFRVLKPSGTIFIYGFSEKLADIFSLINYPKRWLVWHYTNKTVPSLNFWQRSHESIICCSKNQPIFNRDLIREPYSKSYQKNLNGKIRAKTKGRFSNGNKETLYNVHPNGALPRDVIKVPALAGGAGAKERVNHPTQKPILLTTKLIKSCVNFNKKNNLIIVPFAGSGTECLAAKQMNINYIGFEINAQYIELANNRIKQNT